MRETLFSEDFMVLDYLHDLNILISNWYGYTDYETCIIGQSRTKEAIKRTQVGALLSDMSKLQSNAKEVQSFLLEDQHAQLASANLRFHAIVLPPQWAGKTPEKIYASSANDGKRVEIAFFESARNAGAWLRMKAETLNAMVG
jgi:hypothetical protein